jgi:putative ABC transport system permease protein
VLLFALAAAALGTIGFGLFPALQSARRDAAAGANATGRSTSGHRQTRMRAGLVVAQVALSMVLLLGAGLLMRTFIKLANTDLGLDAKHVLIAGIAFPPREQMPPDAQLQFYRAAVERLASVPGVSAAALTSASPSPASSCSRRSARPCCRDAGYPPSRWKTDTS